MYRVRTVVPAVKPLEGVAATQWFDGVPNSSLGKRSGYLPTREPFLFVAPYSRNSSTSVWGNHRKFQGDEILIMITVKKALSVERAFLFQTFEVFKTSKV